MKFKKQHLLLAATIFIFIFLAYGSKDEEPNPAELESKAFIISQHFVKEKVKAPSTAQFPSFDFQSIHLGEGRYKVTSYVDAQNSFGAMIRTNYTAILKYNSGDWADYRNWTLEDLKLDE